MVDTRLRGEWFGRPKFDGLSDVAWRVLTRGMMWANEQGQDGHVPARYVRTLHPETEHPEAIEELVRAGLVQKLKDGIQFVGWEKELGQSSAAYVEDRKEKARKRAQESRGRAQSGSRLSPTERAAETLRLADVIADVRDDVRAHVGKASLEVVKEKEFDFSKEPWPFCKKHPQGADGPCIGCMNAREYRDLWRVEKQKRSADWMNRDVKCAVHDYGDGDYCVRCTERNPDLPKAGVA